MDVAPQECQQILTLSVFSADVSLVVIPSVSIYCYLAFLD